jgi:hypothetical protein
MTDERNTVECSTVGVNSRMWSLSFFLVILFHVQRPFHLACNLHLRVDLTL